MRKSLLTCIATAAIGAVTAFGADARASGYTYSEDPSLGISTAQNPSHWAVPYGALTHNYSSATDYFLLPLPIHQSGENSPPSSSYLDEVEIGYYTLGSGTFEVHFQVTCTDQVGYYIYGGSTYNQTGGYPNGVTMPWSGGSVYIPAGGQCYAYIGAYNEIAFQTIFWQSRTS